MVPTSVGHVKAMPGLEAGVRKLPLPVMGAFGIGLALAIALSEVGLFLWLAFFSYRLFFPTTEEFTPRKVVRELGDLFGNRSFRALFLGMLLMLRYLIAATLAPVDPDTLWWLGFCEGPGTCLFTIIGVSFYLRYRIDRFRHQEILKELNDRQARVLFPPGARRTVEYASAPSGPRHAGHCRISTPSPRPFMNSPG